MTCKNMHDKLYKHMILLFKNTENSSFGIDFCKKIEYNMF